jgi:hypothetical protein
MYDFSNDANFNNDDEAEYQAQCSEITKRMEIAKYYQFFVETEFFGEEYPQEAIMVQERVRAILRQELAVLLGVAAPKKAQHALQQAQAALPGFSDIEMGALRLLISSVMSNATPTPPAPAPVAAATYPTPTPVRPPPKPTPTPTPAPAPPKYTPPAPKPEQKRATPMPAPPASNLPDPKRSRFAKKPEVAAPAARSGRQPQPRRVVEEAIDEEEIVDVSAAAFTPSTQEVPYEQRVRGVKNVDGRLVRTVKTADGDVFTQDLTPQVRPSTTLPFPTSAQMEAISWQQAADTIRGHTQGKDNFIKKAGLVGYGNF